MTDPEPRCPKCGRKIEFTTLLEVPSMDDVVMPCTPCMAKLIKDMKRKKP